MVASLALSDLLMERVSGQALRRGAHDSIISWHACRANGIESSANLFIKACTILYRRAHIAARLLACRWVVGLCWVDSSTGAWSSPKLTSHGKSTAITFIVSRRLDRHRSDFSSLNLSECHVKRRTRHE